MAGHGDRPNIRVEVGHVAAICLAKQVERTGHIPVGLTEPRGGHRQPVWMLREPDVLAKVPARLQVLGCGDQVSALPFRAVGCWRTGSPTLSLSA